MLGPRRPSNVLALTKDDRLVLDTLTPLSGDRKCFRMINGVLVERTVKDVIPALQTNAEGLGKVLDDLVKNYKAKQDELEKWKVRHSLGPAHFGGIQHPAVPRREMLFSGKSRPAVILGIALLVDG